MTQTLHARWILPVVIAAAAIALWRGTRDAQWREIAPGLEFRTIAGEPYCRQGSSVVAVLRIDPKRVRIRVRHFSRLNLDEPPSIVEWQARTKAIAVFNAGQFYPDYSYMGLLVSQGHTISARAHPGFQAALVASADELPRSARVLDLANSPATATRGWSEVAQSFMLFDKAGGLRVRSTTHVANRTAVAEDGRGRLIVAVSEGGYTLADYARLLMKSPLGLTHAMSMDGGLEAELVVDHGNFRYATFGSWTRGVEPGAAGAHAELPAVITLESE